MVRNTFYTYLVFALTFIISGCETARTRTTTKETIAVRSTETGDIDSDREAVTRTETKTDVDGDRTVTERTTVAKTEEDQPEGFLATTWDVIGNVLAFPFRLVAGIIEFIF